MGEVPGTPPGPGPALGLCWLSRPKAGHHGECSRRHPWLADQLAQCPYCGPIRNRSVQRFLTPSPQFNWGSWSQGLGQGRISRSPHLRNPEGFQGWSSRPGAGRMQTEGGSPSKPGLGLLSAGQARVSVSLSLSPSLLPLSRSAGRATAAALSSPLSSSGRDPRPALPALSPSPVPHWGPARSSRPGSTDPRSEKGGLPAPPPSLGGEEGRL